MVKISQRRIASELLGVGQNAIWIAPDSEERVSSAITREDVRKLIQKGVIARKPQQGTSRTRARERALKKRKGKLRGPGSKRGSSIADSKGEWIKKVRSLRRYIRALKDKGLDNASYRDLYGKVGGGFFRNKTHLRLYIEKEGIGVK